MSTKHNVPFFDYPRAYLDDKNKFISIFDEVCSRGAFILQKDLRDFEDDLSRFVGSEFALGVANATDGLELSWMALGLRSGEEVICCTHTMLATASSIRTAGGVPVPVDIGYDNLIDSEAIADAINPRTVGIMPTQLNGRTCNMDAIQQIADRHGLFIVEDAAQALGSRFKGKCAGTFGDAASISFFPAKTLGCFGDAGAIVTNKEHIYDKVYQLHDHGRDINGEVRCWGRNSRLDNIQAAFLKYRLEGYSDIINRRRSIASLYHSRLGILEELMLPPPPDENGDHFDVYQNYEIQAINRDQLKDYLRVNGIGTLIQWGGKAVHQWERLGFQCKLPKAENFFKHCLMLPMNMFISDGDVNYVCDVIEKFYRG